MENMLTRYLDRKQCRTYKSRRSRKELNPLYHEFYYTLAGDSKKKSLIGRDVPPIFPLIIITPWEIPIVKGSYRNSLKLTPLLKLNTLKETVRIKPIRIAKSLYPRDVKDIMPVLVVPISELYPMMDSLVEVEDEGEEEEEFEFI